MKKKSCMLVVLVLGVFFLAACRAADLANGQNYYCPDESYLDVIQTDPDLQVRFTCTDKGKEFEVVFGGPNDSELIEILRDKNEVNWGMGVVLQDGQIIQLYEVYNIRVKTHWRASNN